MTDKTKITLERIAAMQTLVDEIAEKVFSISDLDDIVSFEDIEAIFERLAKQEVKKINA